MFKRFDRAVGDAIDEVSVDGAPDKRRGAGYAASPALEHAVNTALAIGRPLLVSGEPGCGKTELGFAIARKLAVPRVHFFSVKSDAEAQRLFYEYDALRRFHVAQSQAGRGETGEEKVDPRHFIRYQALGRAILDACPPDRVAHLRGDDASTALAPTRSVVIIDEIDKSPRDFPNDLLNELDHLWFRVPELAGWVANPETPRGAIAPELKPIVVITSNLERQLPDAFLRRCVFHHIEHPEDEGVRRLILKGHLERAAASLTDRDLSQVLEFVAWARVQPMDKPPGLAEMIEFARALALRADLAEADFNTRAMASIGALGKTTRDQATLTARLKQA